MIARDLMTADPVSVTPKASIAEAWDVMRELSVRHLPVVAGDALVGMLSDRDLLRFDLGRLLAVEGAEALRDRLGTPVVQVMSTDLIVVEPETELSEIVDILVEHRVGAVPVVEPDTRGLVGIVSYIDVLRAIRDTLEDA